MGIDYSTLKYAKGPLRVESKRDKRLADESAEDKARREVKARSGGKCEVPGCKEKSAHLHHIVYRSKSKKLRWNVLNLADLCVAHHQLEHAGKITIARNEAGELIVTGEKKYLAFKL